MSEQTTLQDGGVESGQDRIAQALRSEKWHKIKKMKMLYIFFLVPLTLLIIFQYVPIYGIVIAFKDFRASRGIAGSEWNKFEHFYDLFTSFYFWTILRNTIIISFQRVLFGFPAPIVLALLLNELTSLRFKKVTQSISYLPHFMSWVVMAGILVEVLSPNRGLWGWFFNAFGREAPNLMINIKLFRPMLVATGIWKTVGWGTIVYLAAISSIDVQLYEAAAIDGASRFQRAFRITLPSLAPVIVILFILRLGHILNAGFEQIFNLYNPLVYEVADIIDTYVYRVGLIERRFDFSTAVGLFKNLVGVMLLIFTNMIVKRFSEYGIW